MATDAVLFLSVSLSLSLSLTGFYLYRAGVRHDPQPAQEEPADAEDLARSDFDSRQSNVPEPVMATVDDTDPHIE